MYNYTRYSPEECDFVEVASLSDVPNGERLYLQVDDLSIVIFNIAGNFFAIADICSHDDGPLGDGELEGFEVQCPRHGATFDVRDGKALTLPAIVDIPAYPVKVVDNKIELGLPKEA